MKKTYNVLSIDFDFFQIVDLDIITECYPDGYDLSTDLSTIVWSSYYANPNTVDKIQSVTANHDMIGKLEQKLCSCNNNIPVLVTNSHVHIFDFIKSKMTELNKTRLNLINIDMHHDMFNSNNKLDCGNWIHFITKEYTAKIIWIANPISKDVYGLDNDRFDMIKEDFDAIEPEKIDAIFLCRSDAWLPPHLDYVFDDFLQFLCKHFNKVIGENCIKSPRNIHEHVEQQKQIYINKSV